MTKNKQSLLDKPIFEWFPFLTVERFIFSVILSLTIFSRFYALGDRILSHDESLHAYYSWLFSTGQGYQHTPTTHGPFQFHLLALTFLLVGDNEFSARLPHAIASILMVLMIWKWRRYLGRSGMLLAAFCTLISPFMLYYGRYARNETFVSLIGLVTFYALLRYLESGSKKHLLLITVASALHFTIKETSFIYTAQILLFLFIFLVYQILHSLWKRKGFSTAFIVLLTIGAICLVAPAGISQILQRLSFLEIDPSSISTASTELSRGGLVPAISPIYKFLFPVGGLSLLGAFALLLSGYGWLGLRQERALDPLVLLGTFVLPQLAPFPVKAFGWNPLDYSFTWPGWNVQALWAQGPFRTAVVLFSMILLTLFLGFLWDWKRFLLHSALFWGIYTLFYTSMFTNPTGLATGIVGSLGYWLEQQGVQRGSQPWYYYLLVQIPIYEYLPAIGVAVAATFGLRRRSPAPPALKQEITDPTPTSLPVFGLLFWWALSSIVAYSIAGEKMPWLTVHISLPMILLTGWGLGQIVERLNWSKYRRSIALVTSHLIILFLAIIKALLSLLGQQPPFQGKLLDQLTASGSFLFLLILIIGCCYILFRVLKAWIAKDVLRLSAIVLFFLLSLLTARTAIRAAYTHPDDATEYLVYAHGSQGVKVVLSQLERLSNRTSGDQSLEIVFDSSESDSGVAWPLTWYLRHYDNTTSFMEPDRTLVGKPVILVDQKNFDKIISLVGDEYYRQEFLRMVWPNQDYFNLTWSRIRGLVSDPIMRSSLWDIWFNRDYSQYAQATNKKGFSLSDWTPGDRMQLFIRKDLAALIWEYGITEAGSLQTDPYEANHADYEADQSIGTSGNLAGQLNAPRGIAIAPDGTLYVADTNNNRIQHFAADGTFLDSWGTFGDAAAGNSPPGTFNQPWALALSPDGNYVYVADTWNHRIQKFSSTGTALGAWGTPLYDPAGAGPAQLWGPRAITVDKQGNVFVSDTGNKRILVYDAEGTFLTQIGSEGMDIGQFEEPVGLAVDDQGYLFVADTWNQRIQVFAPGADSLTYLPYTQWEIAGWYGESLENKPFLALDDRGHLFVTDPEGFRVLEFTVSGEYIREWGEYGTGSGDFSSTGALAVDNSGRVWICDPANNRIQRFTVP